MNEGQGPVSWTQALFFMPIASQWPMEYRETLVKHRRPYSMNGSRLKIVIAMFLLLCTSWAFGAGTYTFKEVWGYLMQGEERLMTGKEPLTDLCLFSARINDMGRLDGPVNIPPLVRRPRRIHLVISAPFNKALMYFCLRQDVATRDGLIEDIVRVSQGFDGIQIDFESIRPEEGGAFLAFLGQLRRRLPAGVRLSVAVPARTQKVKDAYNYAAISALVDRVLVMAYDEHWRTGQPGPIASAGWCREVVDYAQKTIAPQKLVMGLPLYGRVWQDEDVARALKYPQTLALWEQVAKPTVKRGGDRTPFFTYQTTVQASVYFEDVQSLTEKLALYHGKGLNAVGFWRMGQGPAALWQRFNAQ